MVDVKQGFGYDEIINADGGKVAVAKQDSFLAESTFEKERKLLLQGDILVSNKSFDERYREYLTLEKLKNTGGNIKLEFQVLHHNTALSVRKDFAYKNYKYAKNNDFMTVDSIHVQTRFPVNQKFQLKSTQKLKMIAESNGRKFLKDQYVVTGSALKFVGGKTSEDKNSFKVIKCSDTETGRTTVKYLVTKVDENGNEIGNEFAIDSTQCGGLDTTLQVIPEDSFKEYIKLTKLAQNLEFDSGEIYWTPANLPINAYGYASVPLQYDLDGPYNLGPKSATSKGHDFVHRNARYENTKLEKTGSDTWGKPGSICSFTEIAKRWKEKCMKLENSDMLKNGLRYQQCTIQLNEVAFYNPFKRKYSEKKDPLGHAHHSEGECFDVRPFRQDEKLAASDSGHIKSAHTLNFEFLKFLNSMGAQEILYNDYTMRQQYASELQKLSNVNARAADHNNHFHFCLPKNPVLKRNISQCWAD